MVVDLLNLPGHKFQGGEDGGFGVHGNDRIRITARRTG